jgi:hypothetical protein
MTTAAKGDKPHAAPDRGQQQGAPNDFAMAARVRKMTHAPVLIH